MVLNRSLGGKGNGYKRPRARRGERLPAVDAGAGVTARSLHGDAEGDAEDGLRELFDREEGSEPPEHVRAYGAFARQLDLGAPDEALGPLREISEAGLVPSILGVRLDHDEGVIRPDVVSDGHQVLGREISGSEVLAVAIVPLSVFAHRVLTRPSVVEPVASGLLRGRAQVKLVPFVVHVRGLLWSRSKNAASSYATHRVSPRQWF